MWELYAERHAGACLLFDRTRLIEVLMPQLKARGEAFHNPVRYTRAPTEDLGASAFALGSENPNQRTHGGHPPPSRSASSGALPHEAR